MSDTKRLAAGAVVWVELDPVRGHEQAGRRLAVVISTDAYNDAIPHLAVVLPVTSRDRGLPHHVPLDGPGLGLHAASYAMTEQPRAIDRQRVVGIAGEIDSPTLATISDWLGDFLITCPHMSAASGGAPHGEPIAASAVVADEPATGAYQSRERRGR
jgi:mRNA interferase MazF